MKIPRKNVEAIWAALDSALNPRMSFAKNLRLIENVKNYIESILIEKEQYGRKNGKRKDRVRRRRK